jgi:hypothetical protein
VQKAQDGIAEKIPRIIEEKNVTEEEAALDIKDAVRYTVHFPDDSFGPAAQRVIDQLTSENKSVAVKNTWPPEKNSAYKGINVSVTRHDGVVYEVQFHTPISQAVKDKMHAMYEDQRKLTFESPPWQKLQDQMQALSLTLPMPFGAADVIPTRRA